MQNADKLNESFGLPGVLLFDEPHPGMPRARITTPPCTGELYRQGPHLTQWQPAGQGEALFLSERSAFVPGKAIRGGVPVIFPWFGSADTTPIHTSPGAPSHGFARVWPWTLQFAALSGDDLYLSLTLDQTEGVRALGFRDFQLAYEVVLGRELCVRLTVANTGEAPFPFEEALHAYLSVGGIEQVTVIGLEGTDFLDKTDRFQRKTQTTADLRFDGETDRPYLNTSAPLLVRDPVLHRCLHVQKTGSETTVTWNPGAELAAKLPDLQTDDWERFVCVETANTAENAVTLAPREARTMEMRLRVEPL